VTDLVVIRLGAEPDRPAAWAAFDAGALIEGGREADVASLGVLAVRFPEARVVAVVPGEQAALRPLDAPARAGDKLQAAARLLLEDELAEPLDDLHTVAAFRGERAIAAAISKAALDRWLAALDTTGLSVSGLTADYMALPVGPGECVFVAERDRIIASRGDVGFAADGALAAALAPGIIRSDPERHIAGYGDEDALVATIGPIFERRALNHEADLLRLFAQAIEKGQAVELLTGAYRRKKPGGFRFAPWRRAATVVGAAAALGLVAFVAGANRDARVAVRLEERAAAAHQSAFPDFAGDDLEAHARGVLAQGSATANFLDLSAVLAESVEATPDLAIDRVRFDAARGEFSFAIRSGTDAAIEQLRGKLAERGVTATDQGGYRRSGAIWIGEMSARRS
jgi:type II secretion system protein L